MLRTISFQERLTILFFCPDTDDYETLKTTLPLALKLSITDQEAKDFTVKNKKGGGFGLTEAGQVATSEVDFTEEEETFVKNRLVALNEARQLNATHMSIYEKFVL